MRTNIELNDDLIAQAQRFSGLRTKREVVDAALREFVARHRQQQMLSLVGEGLIDPSYDVRQVRAAMSGNLCRCTGYAPIVAAVLLAAAQLRAQELAP